MSIFESVQWPGWEVVQKIGSGNSGTVFEIQRNIDGQVEKSALKVISIPQNPDEIDELRNEGYDQNSIAQHFKDCMEELIEKHSLMLALTGASHPNAVSCDDIRCQQHDDGIGWSVYIKMELLTPLTKALDKTFDEKQVTELGIQMCNVLTMCKSMNIVHGNIKPQNIFVTESGTYKLGNFSAAQAVGNPSVSAKAGTYEFMAPEVYLGQPCGTGADIYSLGLVLYWMMNQNRTPFLPPQIPTASVRETARNRRFHGEALPRPVNGSDDLWQIVQKACAFSPADRYADPEEMSAALTALLNGAPAVQPAAPVQTLPQEAEVQDSPQPTPPEKAAPPQTKSKKKSKTPMILGITAALLACLALVFVLISPGIFGSNPPSDPSVGIPPVQTKPNEIQPAATQPSKTEPPVEDSPYAGEYDITVWVSGSIADLTARQIRDFNNTNGMGITFNATVEAVGEGDAATSMIRNIQGGADLFGFAQDQTSRLIQAGALQALDNNAANLVKNSNGTISVTAVAAGDQLYGYPMTSDNGYFMYYDKSVIPEDAVGSLEALIAACEASGRKFSFDLENSWYTVSFFFGTGCVSEWQIDVDYNFIGINDNFCSDKGLIAAKGIKKLVTSQCYISSSATSDFAAAVPSAVVVSGTWSYENAKSILGDNLGVAELPSFTVDGKTYHLSSFSGSKLIGVKPQSDSKRAAALNLLAQYLTSEKCQLERFENCGWGPSNLKAQANQDVRAAVHLTALINQNKYSRPQGQFHGSWWDIAKTIVTDIKSGVDPQTALNRYQSSIEALFSES